MHKRKSINLKLFLFIVAFLILELIFVAALGQLGLPSAGTGKNSREGKIADTTNNINTNTSSIGTCCACNTIYGNTTLGGITIT